MLRKSMLELGRSHIIPDKTGSWNIAEVVNG